MRTRTLAAHVVVAAAALSTLTARAHHSFAPHFDASKPISISGVIPLRVSCVTPCDSQTYSCVLPFSSIADTCR